MKKSAVLIIVALVALSFTNCEKDDLDQQQPEAEAKAVVGTWQLYKDEQLESIIDEWTGTEWTYVDQWFQNTREDSVIILDFNDDGTFVDRYADVVTAAGTWGVLDDGRYYFDFNQDNIDTNENFAGRRYITVHCENTFSQVTEGNDRSINYYKKMDTTECADQINYMVQ
ncbi:MAG: hypothetical protein AB8B52_14740 [Winogradskyella sp.]|uniref:hypothetical protein n=1 Tax=Winogradskyella sp. TaxID=1883156 RepID=UPI0038595B26